jgi:hypothetical protein
MDALLAAFEQETFGCFWPGTVGRFETCRRGQFASFCIMNSETGLY